MAEKLTEKVVAKKFTEKVVRDFEAPASGATTKWDPELKGFGVRIFAPTARKPGGSRSFFLNYRVDGTERRFTIGTFPDWSAEAARLEAKELRRRIDRGEDPAAEKRDRREAPTVSDLAERYRAEYLPRKAKQSQRDDWNMISKIILPRLGDRKVTEVNQGDMQALHRTLSPKTPVRANRVLAVASKMFSLALIPMEGEIEPWRNQAQGNPCKGVERNQEEGHERFLSEAELSALSDALDAYSIRSTADCVRLIMLTGCRPGEAMLATWEQFDAEPGVWVKPSAHTKQRKVHRVPLSPPALELIERVRADRDKTSRGKENEYVFPGLKRGEPLKQLRTIWEWLVDRASVALWKSSGAKKPTTSRTTSAAMTSAGHPMPPAPQSVAKLVAELAAGLKRDPTAAECQAAARKAGIKIPPALTDARLYDLRHSFASIGAGGGLSLQIIGRLLGHTQHRTTQRYTHFGDDPLREATTKIGNVIAGAGKSDRNVIVLKR